MLLSVVLVAGCNHGVRWEFGSYADAHRVAGASNRVTFVYFRNWYSVECTNFEEQVLKDPEVLAETNDMVCVPLELDWDRPLAQQWQLTAAPAFVIVAPDGNVLARGQAPFNRDELLKVMRNAKARFGPRTQPAPAATVNSP